MPDHRRDNYRGFFSLLDAKAHKLILTVPFGDIENAPIEKQEKYFQLSQEKANRLYNHARTGDVCMPVMNCTTSMETRDESKESFGGAVRVRLDREFNDLAPDIDLILSFSGRPEICDEAMMLALGHGIANFYNTQMLPTEADKRSPYWEVLKKELLEDERIKYMRFV